MEMSCCPDSDLLLVQITQSYPNRLRFWRLPFPESPCHGVIDPNFQKFFGTLCRLFHTCRRIGLFCLFTITSPPLVLTMCRVCDLMWHMTKWNPTVSLVVTSVLTSADVSLTSGSRSPDETDGTVGSVTHSIFVRFTSNFVHLHPLTLSTWLG